MRSTEVLAKPLDLLIPLRQAFSMIGLTILSCPATCRLRVHRCVTLSPRFRSGNVARGSFRSKAVFDSGESIATRCGRDQGERRKCIRVEPQRTWTTSAGG